MTLSEKENRPLACLDEEALKDITAPANLNSGELQDVYKLQTDDFDEPETLEVFYNDGKGGTLREIVFVDPIYADRRPRICVSIDGIQAMHKTISTLTRKVDNLVDTLQRCRGAYYKELSMLREQIYQQALAMRKGGVGPDQIAATLYDPSAFISQTESEVDLEVKKKTEKLATRVGGLETENLRLKKRVAILSIEVTHLENQLATRGQKMDIRDMCYEILDRVKIDTLIRTLRGLMEEHQQELFYNTVEEVLSDFRGLKISDLLKQSQEDAEKISKLGLELLKTKQDLATAIREEKQASEALSQTTKMWQHADSMAKDLEQSLEDAQSELADAKEQVDELKKEPGFLRDKMASLKEEHKKEIEALQTSLENVRKELAEEKAKEPPSTLGLGPGKKGSQSFEGMADAIASTQQNFGPQEQFAIALNILKGTPNSQITKTGEMLKAIVEEARPQLLKELLNADHVTLGTTKQRLAMAQKIMNNIPQEDSALVADVVPPGIGKEMAVKVLEASATEEASGESHAQACGFDPNIDISKKCKWSLMRRFIKKLNSTEVKNLFDELGQRARKAILIDLFDLADPNDLEACAEMIVVEQSIKAFVKGLSDEACEIFLQHTAQRTGEDKAVGLVAPQLQKIRDSRQSIVRHHETVQTEFSCVSDELVLSKKHKEESLFTMDFMLTELPHSRPQSTLSHRSDAAHESGIHTEALSPYSRRGSQAFGYRGARTQEALAVVEEAHQQATAEAEAEALEADKEKNLAEAAKEAALAKEKELAAELEALKANMEREIQERASKIQDNREVVEGDDSAAMAALLAHAKEEAQRAADEKIKEKERALKAAQEAAESQAAAFLERQEAALKAAELLAQREADAREAKRKAEEEAAALRVQRRASDVKIEEAARSMAAAEAAKMAALREREEALEMKAIFERRAAEEEEAKQAAALRQQEAFEAAQRAQEAAEKALEELDAKGEDLSDEERETLKAKAAEEHAAKEAAEKAAQEAQQLAAFAEQRAMEAEKQMNEATVTAHFQVLAKLSRVQAAYASLEDRLRLQEEVTASAERRAKEAEDREQQLCMLVSAKALARQVRQRDRMAQTLLACEQDDEEQWRLAVDGAPPELQSDVRGDMVALAAQYLADAREDEDLQAGLVNLRTLTGVQEFVNATAQAQGHSFKPPTPRPPTAQETPRQKELVAVPRPETTSIATQTDVMERSGGSAAVAPSPHPEKAPALPSVPPERQSRPGTWPSHWSWAQALPVEGQQTAGPELHPETLRDSVQELLADGASRPGSRPVRPVEPGNVEVPAEQASHRSQASPSAPSAPSSAGQAEPRVEAAQEVPQVPQLGPRDSGDLRLPAGAVVSRTSDPERRPGSKPLEVPGMTPSTSSASLAHTAIPSQQLYESASSSSVQASQLSTELTQEPAIGVRPVPQNPAQSAAQSAAPTAPAAGGSNRARRTPETGGSVSEPLRPMGEVRRSSLSDMGLSPSENRLGVDQATDSKHKVKSKTKSQEGARSKSPTSKRLLHLSRGDGDFEKSMEAVQVELQEATADPELECKISGKHLATSLGRKVGPGSPKQTAQDAAQAVREAMQEKGLEENEAYELGALCAGVAAAEAAAQLGYSPQDATNLAASQALAAAQACGFTDDLALQCASQACGAVIGRAAAENKWTPSSAASCAADVLRRFVDANNISYDNLISMTAMTAHEAAETVALVQGLRPEEAALVGAAEAARLTEETVTKLVRHHATSAVRDATGDPAVSHTVAVHSPSTPGQREVSSSSRQSSRGPEDRTPLPRLPGQVPPAGDKEQAAVPGRLRPTVTRRLSISELTLPAMAPSTSRRPSQMPPGVELTEAPSPVPNVAFPEASRIMKYGSGRTTEVDRRASTYLQQMQERRASVSMRKLEPPSPPAPPERQPAGRQPAGPTKPKLQGWSRVREVNDRARADRRVRTPQRKPRADASDVSSPEAPTERRGDQTSRRRGSFLEHLQAQQKVQRPAPLAPTAPAAPPSLAQAAGRVMRLGMAAANKVQREAPKAEDLALDAAFVLQEAVTRGRQGKLRKPERARGLDLRIDPVRPEEQAFLQRRASQRYQPEARQPTEPFAPDVDGLYVSPGAAGAAGAAGAETPRDVARQNTKTGFLPPKQAPSLEGKTFNGLASPGSTARSAEPDPGTLAETLSVSKMSSEKSFNRSREAFHSDAQLTSRALPAEEEPEADFLEELEMVQRMSSRSKPQNATLAPSVLPVGPRKPENSEAEILVQRVCSSLDGKFGSVDAAFLSMSARLNRADDPSSEGAESKEEKEDRKLVQLRSCLVESGVTFKDATLLLQAMRPGLEGALPTLQHVANSLRPGQLPQEALEMAKKKGAFSFSGGDDPNINLESIRGFSNLDARSILERPGVVGRAPPSSAGTRSQSPLKAAGPGGSNSNSPSRSRSKSKGPSVGLE